MADTPPKWYREIDAQRARVLCPDEEHYVEIGLLHRHDSITSKFLTHHPSLLTLNPTSHNKLPLSTCKERGCYLFLRFAIDNPQGGALFNSVTDLLPSQFKENPLV